MRPLALLLALLALVGAAAGASAQAQDAAARREIEAQYRVYERASKTLNLALAASLLAPNFTYTGLDGRILTRQQFERAEQANLASVRKTGAWGRPQVTTSVHLDRLTIHGSQAIALVTISATATYRGRAGGRDTSRTHLRDRQAWLRTAQGWRIRHTDALEYHSVHDTYGPNAERRAK